MDLLEQVKRSFNQSIQTKIDSADALPPSVADAASLLVQTLVAGRKILVCGDGISGELGDMFANQLMHQIQRERPGLPVISLTANVGLYSAIARDTGLNEVYARQIRALGQEQDVLVVVSASGHSQSCAQAMRTALARDMLIVAIGGDDDGEMWGLTGGEDVEIRIPTPVKQRIYEVQLMVLNTLAHLIDISLFGEPV
jgi:DnaA initiator-associating protein